MKNMKKVFAAIATILAVVVMAVTLAGCATNVGGKTYVYEEVRIVLPDDASELDKIGANAAKALVEGTMSKAEVTFNKDGTVTGVGGITTGNWEQDGKTVTIKAGDVTTATLTVNGSKLEQGYKEGKYEFTIVYKQK